MNNFPNFAPHGYQIERELGHNHAGGRVTYLATSLTQQQRVVIKQFQFAQLGSSWAEYDAYEREIHFLRSLAHPSIPRYLDSFETPTGFCLVQEYKKAISLASPRHFTPQEVKQIALAVLKVLIYLQQQEPPIIHRDIKPENILVDRSQQLTVYLVDFGFAHLGNRDVAVSSVVKGTLGFMPPEQLFNRQLTEASDLYSLGITLICLLSKTKSTEVGNLIDEAYRINFKPLLPKLNPSFVKWLSKMVAPSLKHRFAHAAAALEALKTIDVVDHATTRRRLVPVVWLATIAILAGLNSTLRTFKSEKTVSIQSSPTIVTPAPIQTPRPVTRLSPFTTSREWHFTFYGDNGSKGSVSLDSSNFTYSSFIFPGMLPTFVKGRYSIEKKVSDFFVVNFDIGTSLQIAKQDSFWRLYTKPNARGEVIAEGKQWLACYEVTSHCVRYKAGRQYYINRYRSKVKLHSYQKTPRQRNNIVRQLLTTRRCSNCDLRNAMLGGANLWSASLMDANLEKADLRSANLWAANLSNANLKNAILKDASLLGANLNNTDLRGANLSNANMKSVNLSNATLQGANLRKANLENANLEGANLKGVILEGANLKNAKLKTTIMPDGRIYQ